jgi:hypothetical protein
MLSAFEYFVMQYCATNVMHLLENISLYFVVQQVFELVAFLAICLSFILIPHLTPHLHF